MITIIKISILICLSVSIYIFSLDGQFVFDDSEAVVKNVDLNFESNVSLIFSHDFWGANIKSKTSHKSYRPLTILSFRFNKFLSGDKLIPYHFKITNVFIHAMVTLAVYSFLLKVFHEQSFNKRRRKRLSNELQIFNSLWNDDAFLSSCLFAVHPIHVEAVAGIVGRADILCGLFFFAAIWFYDKSISKNIERNGDGSKFKRFICLALCFLCACISMLSKELGVTSLGLCSIYDVVIIQKITIESIKNTFNELTMAKTINNGTDSTQNNGETMIKTVERRSFINNFTDVIGRFLLDHKGFITRQILLVSAVFVMIYSRWAVMDFQGPVFQDIDNPASFNKTRAARMATYNYLYFINFLLFIWPQWLCFDWSMGCVPILNGVCDGRFFFVLVFWSFIAGLVCRLFSNKMDTSHKRTYLMALSFLVVPFLPASNLIIPVGFVIAERILYIPSTGFCMLVVIGYRNMMGRVSSKGQRLLQFSFLMLLAVMATRSIQRSGEWLSEEYLFNSALEVCPRNAKVHYNVGKNAGDRSEPKIAEDEYRIAISINSKYYQAMNNLANLLKDQSRFTEAEELLKDALAIKDDFPAAWMNLGIVLANLKQTDAAERAYMKALSHRKRYADCYYNLGNLYLEQNRNEMALQAWSEATRINPKHVVAWSNTLALLDNTGQIKQAMELSNKALVLLPEVGAIHFNVANLMGKSGDFAAAENHFKVAIRLKSPVVPAIYYANLGVLYHRWKKTSKSDRDVHESIDNRPNPEKCQRQYEDSQKKRVA